jgi:hypothetical protein
MLESQPDQAVGSWAIRPLSDRTKMKRLFAFKAILEAVDRINYDGVRHLKRSDSLSQRLLRSLTPSLKRFDVPRYSRWFEEEWSPESAGSTLEHYFRIAVERRVTVISLAARTYRIDHGQWPDELTQLVPKYLGAVPTNPYFDDGRFIGYVLKRGSLPDGGDRPLVFFDTGPVTDASAGDAAIDTEPMYGWQVETDAGATERSRQHRDLSLWLPTTRRFDEMQRQEQLSAEAVDDQPEQSDTPGDNEEADTDRDSPAPD